MNYPLHRVQPGPALGCRVLSDCPLVIEYHWMGDRPVIHTSPRCVCHDEVVPTRERGYLGALVAHRQPDQGWAWTVGVVELSPDAIWRVQDLGGGRSSLRGARLVFTRRTNSIQSALDVELKGWDDVANLPAQPDLRGFIECLWARFLPLVSSPAANGRPSQGAGPGDPDEEIPFA